MVEDLRRWAIRRGYQLAWGPPTVLGAVRGAIQAQRRSGALAGDFYRSRLATFEAGSRAPWEEPSIILVVVVPRPAHAVTFVIDGQLVETMIPPTYVQYQTLFRDVARDLQQHALPGARVERLHAPLKAVAARLGLVRYGRNNLTYAPGVGSYCQLVGFLTNASLPLVADWQPREPELLPECRDCPICAAVCPTGAIGADRVLLHAERCLTLVNESPGTWPEWIPASAHDCLVGCLRCQRVCPANPELPVENSGVIFSAMETSALLDGDGGMSDAVRTAIHVKLESLGQDFALPELRRNLRALRQAHPAPRDS